MPDNQARTVAIDDDDPAVLHSLEFLLQVLGFKVSTYTSAHAFLDRGAAHPACLILDQHMPGMTGLELVQRLHDERSSIPVLLITGSPSQAIVRRAALLGVEKVLEKPPDEADLLNFVNAYL